MNDQFYTISTVKSETLAGLWLLFDPVAPQAYLCRESCPCDPFPDKQKTSTSTYFTHYDQDKPVASCVNATGYSE